MTRSTQLASLLAVFFVTIITILALFGMVQRSGAGAGATPTVAPVVITLAAPTAAAIVPTSVPASMVNLTGTIGNPATHTPLNQPIQFQNFASTTDTIIGASNDQWHSNGITYIGVPNANRRFFLNHGDVVQIGILETDGWRRAATYNNLSPNYLEISLDDILSAVNTTNGKSYTRNQIQFVAFWPETDGEHVAGTPRLWETTFVDIIDTIYGTGDRFNQRGHVQGNFTVIGGRIEFRTTITAID